MSQASRTLLFTFVAVLIPSVAFAAEGAADNAFTAASYAALAAGFGIAIAASVGALSQGKTASVALEGIARNPGASGKIFMPMILGLALIESLVIYALIIAFSVVGKVGDLPAAIDAATKVVGH